MRRQQPMCRRGSAAAGDSAGCSANRASTTALDSCWFPSTSWNCSLVNRHIFGVWEGKFFVRSSPWQLIQSFPTCLRRQPTFTLTGARSFMAACGAGRHIGRFVQQLRLVLVVVLQLDVRQSGSGSVLDAILRFMCSALLHAGVACNQLMAIALGGFCCKNCFNQVCQ